MKMGGIYLQRWHCCIVCCHFGEDVTPREVEGDVWVIVTQGSYLVKGGLDVLAPALHFIVLGE